MKIRWRVLLLVIAAVSFGLVINASIAAAQDMPGMKMPMPKSKPKAKSSSKVKTKSKVTAASKRKTRSTAKAKPKSSAKTTKAKPAAKPMEINMPMPSSTPKPAPTQAPMQMNMPMPKPSPSSTPMQMEMPMSMPMPSPTPTPKLSNMPMEMNMPTPTPTPANMNMPMPTPAPTSPDTSGERRQTLPPLPKNFPHPVDDEHRYFFFLADLLEFSPKGSDSDLRWDIEGWYGGDYNRLWYKTEGEKSTVKKDYNIDYQLLYSRFVKRYYDFQIGARLETKTFRGANVARAHAVIGIEGLVPFRYELETAMFISQKGDVAGRFTFSRDYLMTQRLVLQPRIEANAAIQKVERFGVGKGLNDVELGFRLRYAVRREFAPYIGVSFKRSFFSTADLVRQDGGDPSQIRFVIGVRMWH
ncbi:MAG: copper resistance protein B [Pyrinomonadaceae bacterium]